MQKLISSSKLIKLDDKSIYLRKLILLCLQNEKRGHVGSAMSLVEILRVLYSKYIKKSKSKFILSKGHGCLALYALLYDKGFIKKTDLKTVGKFNSILGGHPEHDKINGVEISTGALGHGLPIAVGMAIGSKLKKKKTKFYVVCGDGEINEGSIWEALLSASKHKLDNLVLLIDYNKLQSYGRVDEILNLEPLKEKFESFNFNTIEVNGHNTKQIDNALTKANKIKNKPSVIICHTIKGKGIKIAEGNPSWHHKSMLTEKDLKEIEQSLGK
jgi:transketolase